MKSLSTRRAADDYCIPLFSSTINALLSLSCSEPGIYANAPHHWQSIPFLVGKQLRTLDMRRKNAKTGRGTKLSCSTALPLPLPLQLPLPLPLQLPLHSKSSPPGL
jgi:hypothetical protein